ncbi:MAG: OmpP1/FadL family transporter [Fidelibacterota bacterium]
MFKNLSLSLLCLFLVIFLAVDLYGSGVAISNTGSRAVALGSAFRAIASDWSAMYWNPAGLTQISKFHFGFNTGFIKPVGTLKPLNLTPDPFSPPPGFMGLNNGFTINETAVVEKTFIIPSFGFVYSLNPRISVGLSLYVPFGLGADWNLFNINQIYGYNNLVSDEYTEYETSSDLQIVDIHPTVAFKISDKISVGAGVSIVQSKITIRKVSFSDNPLIGTPLGLRHIAKFVSDALLDGSGSGYGFNVGILIKPSDKLSIGASFRYYGDISLDGDATINTFFPYNKGKYELIETMLADTTLDNATRAQLMQAYAVYSGQTKLSETNISAKMPLPIEVGGGVALRPSPKLLISADVSWTQWSTWDIITINFDKDLDEDGELDKTELVENWTDVLKISVGAEYTIFQNDDKSAVLRLGFNNDGSPVPDETISPTIPDIGKKNAILAGLGVKLGKIELGANYEIITTPDRTVTEVGTHNGEVTNLPGTYTLKVTAITMGLTYNF